MKNVDWTRAIVLLVVCGSTCAAPGIASAQVLITKLHFRSTQPAVGVSPTLPYGSNMYSALGLDGTVLMNTFSGSDFATGGTWLSGAGGVQKVRRWGDFAAGLATPAVHTNGGTNSPPRNGRVVFSTPLSPSSPVGQGVWLFDSTTGGNTLIVQPGMTLANAPGIIDGEPLHRDNLVIRSLHLDDEGNAYLAVYVSDLLTVLRVSESVATKIIAEGDAAPFVGPGNSISSTSILAVSPSGDLLLNVDYTGPGGQRRALVVAHQGVFTVRFYEGQSVAGLPADNVARPLNAKMNMAGDAVFRTALVGTGASNVNNDALIVVTSGSTRIAAREASAVPGIPGATWRSTFASYSIGEDGNVVFEGNYSGPNGNTEGLFLNTPSGTTPLIAEGVVTGLDSYTMTGAIDSRYVPSPGEGLGVLVATIIRDEANVAYEALLHFVPNEPTRVLHRAGDLMEVGGSLLPVHVRNVVGFNADGTALIEIVFSTFDRGIVSFNLLSPSACPIDLANQDGEPVADGAIDIADLIFFLAAFEAGAPDANIDDDGQDPLTPDGGVDVNDLISFLRRFEAGC
jgi:hypothetical protein